MKVKYLVEVLEPRNHIVNVKMSFAVDTKQITLFLPSWSPGSYLMREYSKNLKNFKALTQGGEFLMFTQESKGIWTIDIEKSELNGTCEEITVEYEVYCHELTVRTSHIDESHAFLHGPSYLMGLRDRQISPQIEFRFTPLWSKIHTGLKEISQKRDEFIFSAENYDVLIDAPVEIGCHESDGFMFDGKEHHLIWYGETYPHELNLKEDIKTIVKTVSEHFSDIPYESYMFMTHFKRNLYGGLEHLNSTALQFDGRKLTNRADYINWLALVAHEYFHTWNVKRIRPVELGPFDYTQENYTRMHWLTEGLTSFMDEIFVLRSKLCTLEEYLDMQTKNLKRFYANHGKKFQSLEESSFNAWVKFYRPHENSNNSEISYYLKGGLVFSTLHFELKKLGKSVNDLLTLLWGRYKQDPSTGVNKEEVMKMIEDLGGKKLRDQFDLRLSTTEDIDFETYYKEIGLEFEWEEQKGVDIGADFKYSSDQVIVSKVHLDGAAFKAGLNAGDEVLAINNQRFLRSDVAELSKILTTGKNYQILVSRLGTVMSIDLLVESKAKALKEIKIIDREKALDALMS